MSTLQHVINRMANEGGVVLGNRTGSAPLPEAPNKPKVKSNPPVKKGYKLPTGKGFMGYKPNSEAETIALAVYATEGTPFLETAIMQQTGYAKSRVQSHLRHMVHAGLLKGGAKKGYVLLTPAAAPAAAFSLADFDGPSATHLEPYGPNPGYDM